MSRPPSQAVIEAVEQAFRVHVVQGLGWKCTCGVNVEDFAGYERHSYTETARAAEQAADEKWMRWLIEQLHYGIDISCEVDPPCTLADYAAMWGRIEPGQEFMAETIVAETGCWADELTDTDDRSKVMANGLPKPKCGWPEPADQWNINGDVICRLDVETPMRRIIENRTCDEPGPGDSHCTDRPGHDWSCYDARGDVSFNARQDWTHRHPGCPDDGHVSEYC